MIKDALEAVVKVLTAEKDYLSDLDAKVGDGDHGINMARGADAAIEAFEDLDDTEDLKKVLTAIGEAVVMNVGGTAGPLYGTAILEAAKVIDENSSPDILTLEKVFGAAVTGVQKRGHAQKGDKTMLDVLIPIHECFKSENTIGKSVEEVMIEARDAGRDGVEYTKTIPARRGRASYLGERSIGFEDPGAVSSLMICRTLFGYWKEILNK